MSRKLLIVDDDLDCRRVTHRLLTRAGYQVLEAVDGLQGYERLLAERPEIIITDWDMPRSDGLELIRRIREAELPWYPYILLLTASEDVELGLDTGADEFVSKPIREQTLLPRVRAGERIVSLQQRLHEKNVELNRVNQQLAQLATIDPLSGLLNRRAFFEQAECEWRRCRRFGLPLSCLMIDIDHFKQINDTYGHAKGDAVIVALSNLLKGGFRDTDLVSRYGGEEFCILLTNTCVEIARELADDLCQTISQANLVNDAIRITLSIGAAGRCSNTSDERGLIDQADQALMAAKRSGRNQVAVFGQTAELAR